MIFILILLRHRPFLNHKDSKAQRNSKRLSFLLLMLVSCQHFSRVHTFTKRAPGTGPFFEPQRLKATKKHKEIVVLID
jgi:hypothetical protein